MHVTAVELAEACDVCPKTIYNAIAAGKIRPVKYGRQIRIPLDEAERVVNEGWNVETVVTGSQDDD